MIRKEELQYIKEVYEEPDGYLHYTKFSEYITIDNFGIIPDIDHWDEIQYCERPTKKESNFDGISRGVTVCQCVWEMTGKNTHGALVYYVREVINSCGVMPV